MSCWQCLKSRPAQGETPHKAGAPWSRPLSAVILENSGCSHIGPVYTALHSFIYKARESVLVLFGLSIVTFLQKPHIYEIIIARIQNINKGFSNLQLLNCWKPVWDAARLAGRVDKGFVLCSEGCLLSYQYCPRANSQFFLFNT